MLHSHACILPANIFDDCSGHRQLRVMIFMMAQAVTVRPPIMDPPRSGRPLYSRQVSCYGLHLA